MSSHQWRDDANCRDTDPNTMQPESATADELAAAFRVCTGCPVLEQCRQLAEDQLGAYGIHAGTWWGDLPANPEVPVCQWCLEQPAKGTRATYCSTRCQVAAWRARSRVPA